MIAIAPLGCEGAMRAIASSISPQASPQQAPHRYSVPQPQAAELPFKPSAPPRRLCQRPQLVKGKSPQGSRVTVHIEQYLLCSAAQLTSCSSPAAAASRLTSSMLPHVSLGASQVFKHASKTPRSHGCRHRSWHYKPQAQTNCRNLRRQHREATAAGIGPDTTAMYSAEDKEGYPEVQGVPGCPWKN
jgi:hypothetical protein